MEIFYIGGSPCSGKSTVAEALAKQYGLADEFCLSVEASGASSIQRRRNSSWIMPAL